jgi:hypothetical protein
MGFHLEGAKEALRVGNPGSCIAEANHYSQCFAPGAHGQFLPLLEFHGALAILGQVEENLHQALPVSPHRGQIIFNLPSHRDSTISQ